MDMELSAGEARLITSRSKSFNIQLILKNLYTGIENSAKDGRNNYCCGIYCSDEQRCMINVKLTDLGYKISNSSDFRECTTFNIYW